MSSLDTVKRLNSYFLFGWFKGNMWYYDETIWFSYDNSELTWYQGFPYVRFWDGHGELQLNPSCFALPSLVLQYISIQTRTYQRSIKYQRRSLWSNNIAREMCKVSCDAIISQTLLFACTHIHRNLLSPSGDKVVGTRLQICSRPGELNWRSLLDERWNILLNHIM